MSDEKELLKIEDEVLQEKIYEELEKIIDPELGIDIMNLGLIYEVNLYEEYLVEIKLTLTTMGCPFADQIKENIKKSLEEIDRINKVEVKLVWYPAWTPDKMSRYARIALGVH